MSAQSPLINQVDSVSYLIGQSIAKNVLRQMSEANKEMVMKGLGDGLYQKQALCNDPGNATLNAYFQEKNRILAEKAEKENQLTKLAGEKYLEENRKNKDVLVTESGLQYIILNKGNGPKPTATSKVKVHYHGTTPKGEVFDSSVDRGEPITFGLNQVIKGWTEGVQLMPVGSKFKSLYLKSWLMAQIRNRVVRLSHICLWYLRSSYWKLYQNKLILIYFK